MKPADELRKRTKTVLPKDWQKDRDCPECGAKADRPKCMWEMGGSCPRHDPANYEPSPLVRQPDELCHGAAALLDECERVLAEITASFNNGVAPRAMSDSENDIQYLSPSGAMLDSEKIVKAYATLAKLRGET